MQTRLGIVKTLVSLYLAVVGAAAIESELKDGWALSPSASIDHESGSKISSVGYDDRNWYKLSKFPSTVLAALVQAGEYPDLFYGQNLNSVDASRFDSSWWYRSEFTVPQEYESGKSVALLKFKGINYRANIWVNGVQLGSNSTVRGTVNAEQCLTQSATSGWSFTAVNATGTFTYFTIDVSSAIPQNQKWMALAVEVFRPYDTGLDKNLSCRGRNTSDCLDLSMSWVDWAPTPPDVNMGLWRGVYLSVIESVTVRYPSVQTSLSSSTAHLTIRVELKNWLHTEVQGQVNVAIHLTGNLNVNFNVPITLAARETKIAVFSNNSFPGLNVDSGGRLWWPYQMKALGSPVLHNLTISFVSSSGNVPSDSLSTNFGIRDISKIIDTRGNALFLVNGHKILIRGGGYAPDLLQRMTVEKHQLEMKFVRHVGLNAVRLEGKFPDDDFFSTADRMGILIFPGICCCDAWQQWPLWGEEQHKVAAESLQSQLMRLQIHPSVAGFLYSSDELPPPDVEREFLDVFQAVNWFNPTISSASYRNSTLTGVSGVKMTGPYGWVPPNFWSDPRGMSHDYGAAYGFITETSPGAAPLLLESLRSTVSPDELWGPNGPTRGWDFHCGSQHGAFGSLEHFTPALNSRLGNGTSAADYLAKAQIEAYESHRAMFEAYSAAKYNSTGVIQWMLNNGWPEMMWHLFQYDFNVGGSYFGAKKALEPTHLQYSYSNGDVILVNSQYRTVETPVVASAHAFDLSGNLLFKYSQNVNKIDADSTQMLFNVKHNLSHSGTVLMKLFLNGTDASIPATPNVYAIPHKQDDFDMGGCFTGCNINSFANMRDLAAVPKVRLDVRWIQHASGDVDIHLGNSNKWPALFTRLRAVGADGNELLPAFWSDNFITLFSGDSVAVTLSVSGLVSDIIVEPFNDIAGTPPLPPSPESNSTCGYVNNTDTNQDQYAIVHVNSLEECCDACRADSGCQYANAGKGSNTAISCYLKTTTVVGFTSLARNGVSLVLPF